MNAADRPSVLIIGGGLSGLVVAQQLAACSSAHVIVAEAGHQHARDHLNARFSVAETTDPRLPPVPDQARRRPWHSALPPHYAGPTGLRQQLGGRSLCWHGVVLRMDPWVLASESSWPRPLATGDLYESTERDLRAWAGHRLDSVRSPTEEAFLSWARTVVASHAAAAPLAVQRFETESGPRWRAYSPLYAASGIAPAVRDQPDISILAESRALTLDLTGQRPAALLADAHGQRRTVAADAVVLAAGTIENTRLVAQSAHGAPRRYTGLNDHLVQGFAVTVPRPPWGGDSGEDARLVVLGQSASQSNLFLELIDVPQSPGVVLDCWEMGEQEPSESNAVCFPDPAAPPWRSVVRPGLSTSDAGVLAGQRARLRQAWTAIAADLGFAPVPLDFGDYLKADRDMPDYLEKAAANPGVPVAYTNILGSLDHEAGTLPYGQVLASDGQVIGAPGVFVAGPAAFPRSGAANPSLTTIALARHLASAIASHVEA
jgi:choline dehydrogenase-like flavoprotein